MNESSAFQLFLMGKSLWYTSVLDYKHVSRTDYARNPRFYCILLLLLNASVCHISVSTCLILPARVTCFWRPITQKFAVKFLTCHRWFSISIPFPLFWGGLRDLRVQQGEQKNTPWFQVVIKSKLTGIYMLWCERHLAFHCPLAAGGKSKNFLS